jgi:KDO2-lipid IV(A) lauroyltransferase
MRSLAEKMFLAMVSTFFRVLPHGMRTAAGAALGGLFYRLSSGRRTLALENLALAYSGEKEAAELESVALESFRSMGMNLAEFFAFPSLTPARVDALMNWRGEENLAEAMKSGNGVLLLSAHMGNWDLLGASIAMKGYPMSLISKVSRNDDLNRMWMGHREATGIRIFTGKGTMRHILRYLKEGGIVGFVLDQNALPEDGVFVPFFGREACTLSSLAVLARRTGAPVVPVHTYREGNSHVVVAEPALEWSRQDDHDEDILGRTAQYTRWTEEVIRRHPGQWTWLHDRWKTKRQNAEDRIEDTECS